VLLSPRLLVVPRLAAEMERLRQVRKLSLKDLGGPAREDWPGTGLPWRWRPDRRTPVTHGHQSRNSSPRRDRCIWCCLRLPSRRSGGTYRQSSPRQSRYSRSSSERPVTIHRPSLRDR